jgi:hypothetical protein
MLEMARPSTIMQSGSSSTMPTSLAGASGQRRTVRPLTSDEAVARKFSVRSV